MRELVHHLDQAAAADLVAGRQRVEVAHHLDRLAHVGAHDLDQRLVDLALAREAHQRDVEAFLVDLAARRRPCRGRRCRRRGRCRRTAPTILPRRKVGVTKVKSCRWPVPFHGSLVRKMSPSFIVSAGNCRRKWPTARAIELTWPGVPVTAWASMRAARGRTRRPRGRRPRASRSRSRCASASAPAPRRPRSGGSTSAAGGWATSGSLTLMAAPSPIRMAPIGSIRAAKLLRHDGRRLVLGDDRRAGHVAAERKVGAMIDRHVLHVLIGRIVDRRGSTRALAGLSAGCGGAFGSSAAARRRAAASSS